MADGSDIVSRLKARGHEASERAKLSAYNEEMYQRYFAEMRDCEDAADLIERLRERLEMNFAYREVDGKMTKVAVEPGSIPDGIECRDETIKLQDKVIERLRAQAPGWRGMDSAPKDGTRILVFRPKAHARKLISIDWWDLEYGKWWISPEDTQPSLWQPLPSPPAEGLSPTSARDEGMKP